MKENLKKISNSIRMNIIKSVSAAKSGHPGGSLSIADILTVLYFEKMNIDPKNPKTQIEIDLYYQRDIQHQRYMLLQQKEDIFLRKNFQD